MSPGATQLTLSTNAGTNPGVGTTAFPHAIGCSSAGNCTAVGGYVDSPGEHQVMVVTSLATPTTPTIGNLPASGTYGGNFTAIVSTNGDGSTSVTSNSTSICTVSGFVVSYVGVGTCSLTAHVSAGTDYGAADGSARTLTVDQASQTISFTAPASGLAGGSATLSATGGASGNAVVFSVDPSSGAGVCNVSGLLGTTVNYTATGSCVIDANQAGNGNYAAATEVPQTIAVSSAPQGNWVGSYGGSGYALAAWNGSSDATYLPDATLSLVKGVLYRWNNSTTDVRALESDDQSTRRATCWYASSQLELQLSFSSSYSGNLELYALDWDSTARTETISVNGGSPGVEAVALTAPFTAGAWMVFPIVVVSGGTVTITVQLTGGASAVLSGIFLGGPGIAVSSAPQGNWVGSYGGSGYALAAWNGSSDATYLPDATLSLVEGNRYQWNSSTTDVRALESDDQSTREATCWYASSQLELQLSFSSSYSGNLELYALDWDSLSRSESISVNGGSPGVEAVALTAPFTAGAWMVFPIVVASGGTVTITVQLTGGANVVLSGIFLGEGTALPSPRPPRATGWAATGDPAAVAAWNGSSDATYLPDATLSLVKGVLYRWNNSTTDVRALESDDQSTRRATCWYSSSELELSFRSAPHTAGTSSVRARLEQHRPHRDDHGELRLSWRRGGLTHRPLHRGAWMVFPIVVLAGGTVTITVQLTGGANAVLSGIFLGGPGHCSFLFTPGQLGGQLRGSRLRAGGLERAPRMRPISPMPRLSLVQGNRYQWNSSTTDVRALESPDQSTREATCWYASSQLELQLSFSSAYSGNLELYALDWDSPSAERRSA